MRASERAGQTGLAIGLIVLGIFSRLLPHPWNATPVTAIALFGGTYLSRRWGVLLPLAIVMISDPLIYWHWSVIFNWIAFALIGTIGWWLRRKPSVGRIACAALAGSALFFLVSNLGVWAAGQIYPRTAAGLWECYFAGLSFFRHTASGDLFFTAVIFGTYNAVRHVNAARQPAVRG